MSAEDIQANEAGSTPDYDLDEDLFNFDELDFGESFGEKEEEDLRGLLANMRTPAGLASQVEEEAAQERPAPAPSSSEARPGLGYQPSAAPAPTPASPHAPPLSMADPVPPAPHTAESRTSAAHKRPEVPLYEDPFPLFAEPAARPARRRLRVGPGLWLVLIAVTVINGSVAVTAVRSTSSMEKRLLESGERAVAANDTAPPIDRGSDSSTDSNRPVAVVPPNPENHPTFELALEDIERGAYGDARQRLYSLLAILDRLDPEAREEVEARANFLLAQTRHLEAMSRKGGQQ